MFTRIMTILFSILCIVYLSCFSSGPTASSGGSGSEIVGNVQTEESAKHLLAAAPYIPLVNGFIYLYRKSSVPEQSWIDNPAVPIVRTDSKGNFRILNVPIGEYYLEASDGNSRSVIKSVNVLQNNEIYDVGTLFLKGTGKIQIKFPETVPANIQLFVSVKGTRFIAEGNNAGLLLPLDNIPSYNDYTVHIEIVKPFPFSYDMPDISVAEGLVTTLMEIKLP